MVIWVFSGGGQTELEGLIKFLMKNFRQHQFIRKTPIRPKPAPKPGIQALGKTGHDLASQIRYFLPIALATESCHLILVLDDLDCHDYQERQALFQNLLNQMDLPHTTKTLIGFAIPEIESWLVADWKHTFENDRDLKKSNVQIRNKLAERYRLANPEMGNFEHPESYSFFDNQKGACHEKLSETIQEVVLQVSGIYYSKAEHSGSMLQNAQAIRVQDKCPGFRKIYRQLCE